MAKKLSKEEYIEQLKTEHPNLELLSDYNGNKEYITVRCKRHDYTFKTKPNWLHSGQGCKKCYNERRGEKTRKTTKEFIEQAREIHGEKYDYSKVEYINSKTKVCIICPEHGEFWITPNKHINRKQGCSKCASIKNGIAKRLKFSEFLKRAKKMHGDFYKYDESTYVSAEVDLRIICPVHGEFWQKPFMHTNGCGCPFCKESHLEKEVNNFLLKTKINFKRQQKFDWLGRQSLDFYLPKQNIAIECQGKQHFEERKFFGGKEGLSVIKERDNKKFKLVNENKIIVFYVVDNDVDVNDLPKDIYNSKNTFHINEINKKISDYN